ncbi:MAG: hypothetical protein GY874_08310 [Desulfobacteraceae bacterium]|nr:hypothetical protein [Desulfobacteraceae bacterium]
MVKKTSVTFLMYILSIFLTTSVFASPGGIFGESVEKIYGIFDQHGTEIGFRTQTFMPLEEEEGLYIIEDEQVVDTTYLFMNVSLEQSIRMIYDGQNLLAFDMENTSVIPFAGTTVYEIKGDLNAEIWHITVIKNGDLSEADVNINDFDWLDILTPMIPWAVQYPDTNETKKYKVFSFFDFTIAEIEIIGGMYDEADVAGNTYQIQNLAMKDKNNKVVSEMSVFEDSIDFKVQMHWPVISPVVLLEDVILIE